MTKQGRINRGTIWNVELTKNPSDTVGHEQGLTRPCLIIGNYAKANMCTIIPLTSNLDANKLPFTYLLESRYNKGLNTDSIVLIFQIRCDTSNEIIEYKIIGGNIKIKQT